MTRGVFHIDNLVQRLSRGDHPVTVGGPESSIGDLQKRVEDMGYVFIRFISTRGGTDLGIHVDKSATNTTNANFSLQTGIIHIEGTLTLDYVNVRCIADIDLATLNGTGHLTTL